MIKWKKSRGEENMKDLEKEKPDWKKKKREKLSTSDYKCAAKG